MKNTLKIALFTITVVLLIYLQREFFPKTEVEYDTITNVVYKDTIIYVDSIVYVPKPYKVEVPSEPIYIPVDCDSLKNLYINLHKDYFTSNFYLETFNIDTIGSATIDIAVKENKIDSIKFNADYRLYEKIITTTIVEKSNNWYVYGETNFNSLSVGTMYSKNKFIYKGTYNINDKTVSLGIGYKIW